MVIHAADVAGDLGPVPVGQEDRHVRRGGHVRLADRHDPQGVPHADGAQQRAEPRLQRGALRLPQGHCARHQAAMIAEK